MPAFTINGMIHRYSPFNFTIRDNWTDTLEQYRNIYVVLGDELFEDRGSGYSSIVAYSPQGNFSFYNNSLLVLAHLTTGIPPGNYPQGHQNPIFTVNNLGEIRLNTDVFNSISSSNPLTLAMKICIRVNTGKSSVWGLAVGGLGFAMGLIGYGATYSYMSFGYAKPTGLHQKVGVLLSGGYFDTWLEIDVRMKYTQISGTHPNWTVSGMQKGRIFRISNDFTVKEQIFPIAGGWNEESFSGVSMNNNATFTGLRPGDPLEIFFNPAYFGGSATVMSGERVWVDYIRYAGAWEGEFDLYNSP